MAMFLQLIFTTAALKLDLGYTTEGIILALVIVAVGMAKHLDLSPTVNSKTIVTFVVSGSPCLLLGLDLVTCGLVIGYYLPNSCWGISDIDLIRAAEKQMSQDNTKVHGGKQKFKAWFW